MILPKKSTLIGEAAHIYGARPNAKRYDSKMTDVARAEITNAIWVCRNCHKLVDTDPHKYPSEILFAWREQHERYVQAELGSATDRIRFEEQSSRLSLFDSYPPIIRRIVIDKPDGWEWRLTAELMRHLNHPLLRKFNDLRDGLYVKPQEHISSSEDVIEWVRKRLVEGSNLMGPIVSLIERLNESWGSFGEPGNVEEIHHICCMIRDNLEQILKYEEQINFVNVPEEYETLVNLIKGLLGSQVQKLADIPIYLDEVVSLIEVEHGGTIENPYMVKKSITFDIPKEWERQMDRELKRAERHLSRKQGEMGAGVWSVLLVVFFLIWVFF